MARRADRLFEIVQHLRGRRLVTARALAEKLEVSERTIYRDIADLQASGVPVEGEAGVGYVLRAGFDLPPLMFSRKEVEAVALGLAMAQAFGGAALAQAALAARAKVAAVLPPDRARTLDLTPLHATSFATHPEARDRLDALHEAIETARKLHLSYTDEAGATTHRTVRPLGLFFWGHAWTLVAWCELRSDFRQFRPDRMAALETTLESFRPEAGKRLQDYLATVCDP